MPTPQTARDTDPSRLARTTFHFTRTWCSWATAVEGCFARLTLQRLKRGVFTSIVGLQTDINRFVADANDRPEPSGSNPSTPISPLSSAGPKPSASGRNQTDDSRHRASHRDCFVAPLLAMTVIWGVIASEAKQSR